MSLRKESIVAVVPVREGSTRIPNKNFLPFGKEPTLIHNKIEQLKKARCFDHIYISSHSERIREIAESLDVEFLARDPSMCTAAARWDEVVVNILNAVPENPHIVWAMVTSPLFTRYQEAVDQYLKALPEYDSLVGVKEIREYLIDEKGRPLFYSFGVWHPYTNELKPMYAINDTIFIGKKSNQLLWRYWIGRKPYLFSGDPIESIDVNFPKDLTLARVAYEAQA